MQKIKPGNYGKRELITGPGRPVIQKHNRPKKCLNCKLDLDNCKYFDCGQYKNVYFCGKKCKVPVWKHHKTLCQSIFTLNKSHQQNVLKQGRHANDLFITEKTKVATLTGDNCLIDCQLEGVSSTAFLDAFNFSEKHPKNELSDL